MDVKSARLFRGSTATDTSYSLMSLSTAAVTGALMHIKPIFITYLEYVLPSHSTYLLS